MTMAEPIPRQHWRERRCAILIGSSLLAGCLTGSPSGGAGGSGGCVETVLCARSSYWDSTACACLPNPDGGGAGADAGVAACRSSADCQGALPQLCQVCADGSEQCAHHECVAGKCEIATCPIAAVAGQSCGPDPIQDACPSGLVCVGSGGGDMGRCIQDPDGQACGPDAVSRDCPDGYTCSFMSGAKVGRCTAF